MEKAMEKDEFYHLRFVRDLDNKHRDELKRDKKLGEYLLLDYFDFFILEKTGSFEQCALGKKDFACEAEQGLGIFRLGDDTDGQDHNGIRRKFPFSESGNHKPFLGILQLTTNPIFYKKCNFYDSQQILQLESSIEREINSAFTENSDNIVYQIYQTVNAADFCVILLSKKVEYLERLSKLLKRKTFIHENNGYLMFSVYETIGIHENTTSDQLRKAFSRKHSLVSRIRVKDSYWNGIQERKAYKENENCKLNTLSGRYHFSIRINQGEIALTVKDIIDFKFKSSLPAQDSRLNILRQMMAEDKISYINERILVHDEIERIDECKESKEHPPIKQPEYTVAIRPFEEIREYLENKIDKQNLEVYLEKIQSLYHMQNKLSRYADTHISVMMFHDYYEAFLEGLLLEIKNIQEANREDMLDELLYHLTLGLRYLYQYADIIYSINSTTFQAPQYDVPNIKANPKLSIAYTEFLRSVIDDYRDKRKAKCDDEEKQFFPNYIPLIIPEIIEGYADFSMLITFPQGFIDDWALESKNWENYIENGKKTPLFVICQKFRLLTNIPDVLTLSFHELGHYCNYLSRRQRNEDLIEMMSSCVSEHIIHNLINADGVVHCFECKEQYFYNRFPVLNYLNSLLEKGIIQFLKQELKQEMSAPELVFSQKMLERIKALLDPKPMYCSQEELEKDTINMILEKIRYNFGTNTVNEEKLNTYVSFGEKSKYIFECVVNKIKKILKEYEDVIEEIAVSGNNMIKSKMQIIIKDCKKALCLLKDRNNFNELNNLTFSMEDNMETVLKEFKTYKQQVPVLRDELEQMQQLEQYYKEIQQLFSVIWEYEELWNMFRVYSQKARKDSLEDFWCKKKKLIQKVCQNLKSYFEVQDIEKEGVFPHTMFDKKMITILQLTVDMDQQQLFDMLSRAFLLRIDNVDNMMSTISVTYAEGFADLFMCEEMLFGMKEYLIVMAKYARGSSEFDNSLRLDSIVAVVLVLMMKTEETGNFDNIFDRYMRRGMDRVFEDQNKDFFEQMEYALASNQKKMLRSGLTKRLPELKNDICDRLKSLGNSNMKPLIRRMYYMVKDYKELISYQKVSFVKKSLNAYFNEEFGIKKTDECSETLKDEMEFLREYYYKNRMRYMRGKQNG